jgi:hypothetical protein
MKPNSSLRNLYGLALRNLWTRKTRTLLTALGIVLGVAVILAINIANSSTLASINKIFDDASGLADLVIVPSSLTGQGFSEATLGRVKSTEGVEAAVPSVSATTLLAQDARAGRLTSGWAAPRVATACCSSASIRRRISRRGSTAIAGRFLERAIQLFSHLHAGLCRKTSRSAETSIFCCPVARPRCAPGIVEGGPGLLNSGAVALCRSTWCELFLRGGGGSNRCRDGEARFTQKLVAARPAPSGQRSW